ncbi:MAG: TIGR03915 family putative DNA repair protein [Pseudomonadota bacterium]
MIGITLPEHDDFAHWRAYARQLLQAQIAPEQVTWRVGAQDDLFAENKSIPSAQLSTVTVPADFFSLANTVSCHKDPQRYALLYRIAWRLQTQKKLLHIAMDDDVWAANQMAKQVGREVHKIKAFVRFRECKCTIDSITVPIFISWFEPKHYSLKLSAAFFVKRFFNTHWAILTPYQSLYWDQKKLYIGLGAEKHQAPAEDRIEEFWLTYYAHIFNPARLKVNAMLKEMPRYYWDNLPEARLIPKLIAQANERKHQMIRAKPTVPVLPSKTQFDREKWLDRLPETKE